MPRYFTIVCMGRTGSTMLASSLNAHPEILCRGELFDPNGAFPGSGMGRSEYLRHMLETDLPVAGFKMPYEWIRLHPGIVEDFREMDFRLIHLMRTDQVAHFVSPRLAALNEGWVVQKPHDIQQIEVSPWDFVFWLGFKQCATRFLKALCEPFPHIEVTYERLLRSDGREAVLESWVSSHSRSRSPPSRREPGRSTR